MRIFFLLKEGEQNETAAEREENSAYRLVFASTGLWGVNVTNELCLANSQGRFNTSHRRQRGYTTVTGDSFYVQQLLREHNGGKLCTIKHVESYAYFYKIIFP